MLQAQATSSFSGNTSCTRQVSSLLLHCAAAAPAVTLTNVNFQDVKQASLSLMPIQMPIFGTLKMHNATSKLQMLLLSPDKLLDVACMTYMLEQADRLLQPYTTWQKLLP